ncbi:trans-1,2-dihydrobenzene-1,2-diol dehydrogenase-like [Cydia splendana]|uniref:trans-1,2-dihydrobenzene-1,2-diol dehydrogenase-like n=1 Tax=Cydia splendana TaxID=1100963 RepID=UPI002131B599
MTIRWGIVSAGKIANDFVNAVNSYPEKGDQAIVAVAARDRSRAEAFAKTHSIPKVFDTYQAMAESEGVIDVAYIGALHPDHYPLAKLFLEHGKHVLCEKPLCLNLKQTQSLINIAKKNKRFLMEAVWSRFAPAYLALEKEIASGKLGEVKRVEANFGISCLDVIRLTKKDMGGSAVMDLGVYVLQFAQLIFKDEPTKVTVVGETNAEGVDVGETIILEYSGGRRAVLTADATVKMWNKGTVTGTKGRLTVEDPFHFPTTLIHSDGTVEEFKLHDLKLFSNFINSAGLVYESLEVARCIREGLLESPRMSHRESLILAKLEDTVRKQLGVRYDIDDQEF